MVCFAGAFDLLSPRFLCRRCCCSHNNKTAIYQHPLHPRPPPPYQRPRPQERGAPKQSRGERRTPGRSHSHRSTQNHRVLDPNTSLPRRSKSFQKTKEQEQGDGDPEGVSSHERQLSTMTYVPPSPYQIKGEPLSRLESTVSIEFLSAPIPPHWNVLWS